MRLIRRGFDVMVDRDVVFERRGSHSLPIITMKLSSFALLNRKAPATVRRKSTDPVGRDRMDDAPKPERADFLRAFPVIVKTREMDNEINTLTELADSNDLIQSFIENPNGNGLEAMRALDDPLAKAGYSRQYRDVGIWDNPAAGDANARSHYVIVAQKDGVSYVVDPTAGQFTDLQIRHPIIDIEENWARHYLSGGNALIKYQEYSMAGHAGSFAGPARISPPDFDFGGATVVSPVPQWYDDLMLNKQQAPQETTGDARPAPKRRWLARLVARVPGMRPPRERISSVGTGWRAQLRRRIWARVFNIRF